MSKHWFFMVFLLMLLWCNPNYGQQFAGPSEKSLYSNYAFKTYTIADGIPSKNTTAAFKDRRGFIWIGTENGLCRFDGHNFKVFSHRLDDPASISNNVINTIAEDGKGRLWIGTMDGLNVMNPLTEQFQSFHHNKTQATSISNSKIWSLLVDRQGSLWVGTEEGFNHYNEARGTFTSYLPNPRSADSIVGKAVNAIVEDKAGKLWLGNWSGGLNQFDKKTKRFRNFQQKKLPGLKNPNDIWSLACDENGTIWVGTYWNGLFNFNPRNQTFTLITPADKHNPGIYSILPVSSHTLLIGGRKEFFWLDTRTNKWEPLKALSNYIFGDAYQDRDGIIWITARNGLMKLDRKQYKFSLQALDLDNADVKSTVSKDGQLWVGTGSGLYVFDERSGKRSSFNKEDNNNSFKSNDITELYFDSKGILWILTENGFDSYDLKRKLFTHYEHHSELGNSFNEDVFRDILEVDPGVYYLATDAGLKIYNGNDKSYKHYFNAKNDRYALSNNHLVSLLKDHTGAIWIGTYGGGLNRFDPKTGRFEVFRSTSNSDRGPSSDIIWGLFQDAERNIWVATQDGLNRFDFKTRRFTVFSKKDGLSNNVFREITSDRKGNLWINTENGISRLNPKSKDIKNFDEGDGIQVSSTLFNNGKELILTGAAGQIRFDPLDIDFNKAVPAIYFTDFRIFNKIVVPGLDGPLKENLNSARRVTLNFDQRDFSFEFVALNYRHSEKNEYAYKLLGFDKEWNYVGTERKANYTNLNPGTYKLWVRASNNDGRWNEEGKTLIIQINPPWYRAWWAYLMYFLVIGTMIYVYLVYRNRQQELRYQIKVSSLEYEKERELNEKKLDFFTNVSHELRTPLTLIVNPIKDILGHKEPGQEKNDLNIVYRNSRRLLSLVDQLLLFKEIESENNKLKIAKVNLSQFTRDIFLCFSYLAKSNNITYNFTSQPEEIIIYADKDKLEIVLFNLLSNAFKFTPLGGAVTLTLEEKDIEVLIKVIDNGMGISEDIGDKLFDKFYKILNNDSLKMGFGIGLYLVKNLVELHQGKINYTSTKGNGTTFSIQMPLNKRQSYEVEFSQKESTEFLYVNELIGINGFDDSCSAKTNGLLQNFVGNYRDDLWRQEISEEQLPTLRPSAKLPSAELSISAKRSILIIDDDSDMRNYIGEIFKDDFQVYESPSAEKGLIAGKKYLPDIIISDVNMGNVSGLELCRQIKADVMLNQIPIILITGEASSAVELLGFETGAVDFISKPFEKELLVARVNNILRQKADLLDHFYDKVTLNTNIYNLEEEDKEFLRHCIVVIEKNLLEQDFGVRDLADVMAMSYSSFYKRVRLITGDSVQSFVMLVRIRKAAEILINTNCNVNQAALRVGIADIKYFRKHFVKTYALTPSEFISRHRSAFGKKYTLDR